MYKKNTFTSVFVILQGGGEGGEGGAWEEGREGAATGHFS